MFRDLIRRSPRLFDYLKAVKRRLPVGGKDVVHDFMRRFSDAHGRKVYFVQIGANDGLRNDPVREFVFEHGWEGVLVEPQPDVFELLRANYSMFGGLDLRFVNAAVSDSDDSVLPFWTFDDQFLAGLPLEDRLDLQRKASFDREHVRRTLSRFTDDESHIRSIDVPCVSMDTLLRDNGVEREVDILVIDAEGHETAILGAIDYASFSPEAILFESHNLAERHAETVAMLEAAGYRVERLGGDSVALRT